MTSGWASEPEVAVDTEEIKPSWRERLADWWQNSQPRDGLAVAGTGFTSWTTKTVRGSSNRRPQGYRGLHRAPETLDQGQEE